MFSIFGLVLLALFAAIVYFHYTQGIFSATLSAILAVISAALAFSYHETIVENYLAGYAPNVAHAAVLGFLFAILYTILRFAFDAIVPRGVVMPAMVDKIGGAVMGAVAATCAVGIIAIAAQELPFGPSVVEYTTYKTQSPDVTLPAGIGGSNRQSYSKNFDELVSKDIGHFDEHQRSGLLFDELVVGAVNYLGDMGSLQAMPIKHPLNSVHPDFLQELFAQRVGIQAGVQHVANPDDKSAVELGGIFTTPPEGVRVADGVLPSIRQSIALIAAPPLRVVEHTTIPGKAKDSKVEVQWVDAATDKDNQKPQMLVIVRLTFGQPAAESDTMVRISPGTVRLVAKRADGNGILHPYNYYPLGTVEEKKDGPVLFVNRPDDFLFVPVAAKAGSKPAVDFLFSVDKEGFVGTGNNIDAGTFVEFKRLVRFDLDRRQLEPWFNDPKFSIGTLHQVDAPEAMHAAGPAKVASRPGDLLSNNPASSSVGKPTPPPAASAVLNIVAYTSSPALPRKISLPASEKTRTQISIPASSLSAMLKEDAFNYIRVDPQTSTADLSSKGDFSVEKLFSPAPNSIWQIISDAPKEPWTWLTKSPAITLVDSTGAETKPYGCWALINDEGIEKFYVRYDPAAPLTAEANSPTPAVGKPTKIGLIFLLPAGATPKQLKVEGVLVKDLTSVRMTPAP